MAEDKSDSPWPLVVTHAIDDEQMAKVNTDEWAEAVVDSMLNQVCHTAYVMLREAGRMREVRTLKLSLYDHNITNQPTGEA